MSRIDPLADDEFDERFHVTGRTAIQFMLAGYAKEHESFSVHFNGGQDFFLTTLLAVDIEAGRLIFDCSGSPESNRRFLASEKSAFAGRPGGIRVQFHCERAGEIRYEGSPAYAVPLPKILARLQRREYFRVPTPRVNPLTLQTRLPNGQALKLPLYDISVSGIGLDAATLPEGVAPDLRLARCFLQLPGEARDLEFAAVVRRVVEQETRGGSRYWRIGIQFDNLSTGDETRIQRYIDRVERERRELL